MTGARLDVLSSDECRRLLTTQSFGRIGVVRGGFPLIVPVNYALHKDRIVVHTDAGTKFYAARHRRVSFEVESIDTATRSGWSVLVQGFGLEVLPGQDPLYDELVALPIEPWAPGDRNRVLLITPITITGRKLSPGDGGNPPPARGR